jgi:hypothetical protein
MILGIPDSVYTFVHVLLSVVGIGTGFVVMYGLIERKRLAGWTGLFLATTIATSVTGFGFPAHKLTPAIVFGIISLLVLAVTVPALYRYHLAGAWRSIYVVGSALALYLNVFVLVVQAFRRVPLLKELAPTQSEPPFLVAQLAVLAIFIMLTIRAVKRFRSEPIPAV